MGEQMASTGEEKTAITTDIMAIKKIMRPSE